MDTAAADAIYVDALPGMLRQAVRAALQTWSANAATVQSVGTGCGNLTRSAGSTPRIGAHLACLFSGLGDNELFVFATGFSASSWNGIPLPLALESLGSQPGCVAYNDVQITAAWPSGTTGLLVVSVGVSSGFAGLGFAFYTQGYAFDGSSFRSSNGLHAVVGL